MARLENDTLYVTRSDTKEEVGVPWDDIICASRLYRDSREVTNLLTDKESMIIDDSMDEVRKIIRAYNGLEDVVQS